MTGALRMFALLAVVTVVVLGMQHRAATAQQTVYAARAGAGAPGYSVNLFLPSTITVHAGDSIRWDFPWFEGHTVSFGQPDSGAPQSTPSPATYDGTGFVTSDLQFGPGRNYEVQFPNEGTFELWCVIHPGMRGTVQVVPASQPVDAQSAIDVAGEAQFQAALAELQEIAGNRAADPPQRRTLADGTTEHTVIIAYSSDSGDVQQYFPPDVAVKTGDTVVWRSVVRAPHTVTFGPIPEGVPRPGNPEVDRISKPADTFSGDGYWNSGVLGLDSSTGPEFSLRFETAGTFDYYCIIHRRQGHTGTITVAQAEPPPASPTPRPPATGGGVAQGDSPPNLMLFLAGAAAMLALSAGAWNARRMHR